MFPDISSRSNKWNESDDKIDEEESISKYCTLFSENIFFFILSLWNQRKKHINNYYAVTVSMLCVVNHIGYDVFKNEQNNYHIQVNTVIKVLFAGSTEK